jgi:hypothetical protein
VFISASNKISASEILGPRFCGDDSNMRCAKIVP